MSMFSIEKRSSIPHSAYEQMCRIPKKDRCSSCGGKGWVLYRHGTPTNEYRRCSGCDGDGTKRKERELRRLMREIAKTRGSSSRKTRRRE